MAPNMSSAENFPPMFNSLVSNQQTIHIGRETYYVSNICDITFEVPMFSNVGYEEVFSFDKFKERKEGELLCVRNPKLFERSVKASQRDMNHRHYLRAKSLASSFKKVEPRAVSPGKMH